MLLKSCSIYSAMLVDMWISKSFCLSCRLVDVVTTLLSLAVHICCQLSFFVFHLYVRYKLLLWGVMAQSSLHLQSSVKSSKTFVWMYTLILMCARMHMGFLYVSEYILSPDLHPTLGIDDASVNALLYGSYYTCGADGFVVFWWLSQVYYLDPFIHWNLSASLTYSLGSAVCLLSMLLPCCGTSP